jgi:hypothetical protein
MRFHRGTLGGSCKEARGPTEEGPGSAGNTSTTPRNNMHHERPQVRGRTIHTDQGQKWKMQMTLTQLSGEHRTIQIEADALEFPVGELQEKIKALGQLNIVISRLPIQRYRTYKKNWCKK